MGNVLIINRKYAILKGKLEGTIGKLVAYDALANEATLRLDDLTLVVTNSENLVLME